MPRAGGPRSQEAPDSNPSSVRNQVSIVPRPRAESPMELKGACRGGGDHCGGRWARAPDRGRPRRRGGARTPGARTGDADVWFAETTPPRPRALRSGAPHRRRLRGRDPGAVGCARPRGQAGGAARRRRLRRRGVRGAAPRGAPGRGRARSAYRGCDRRHRGGHHRRRPALRQSPSTQPPAGWTLANPEDGKPFVAALLRGARVRAPTGLRRLAGSGFPIDDAGQCPSRVSGGSESGAPSTDGVRLTRRRARLPFDDAGELTIRVDDCEGRRLPGHPRLPPAPARGRHRLRARRGAGTRSRPSPARASTTAGLAPEAVAGVFSIDLKSDEPAVHALAESLGVPARFLLRRLSWKRRRRGSGTPRTSCSTRSAATGWRRARLSRRRGRRASSSSRRPSRCVEPAPSPAPRHRSMHPRSARPAASWRWSGSAPEMPAP